MLVLTGLSSLVLYLRQRAGAYPSGPLAYPLLGKLKTCLGQTLAYYEQSYITAVKK
jgi:hypothetical protein